MAFARIDQRTLAEGDPAEQGTSATRGGPLAVTSWLILLVALARFYTPALLVFSSASMMLSVLRASERASRVWNETTNWIAIHAVVGGRQLFVRTSVTGPSG